MRIRNFRKAIWNALAGAGLLLPCTAYAADLNTNLVVNGSFENVDLATTGEYNGPRVVNWAGINLFAYSHDGSSSNAGVVPDYADGANPPNAGHWYFTSNNTNNPAFTSINQPDQFYQDLDLSTGATGSAIASGTATYLLQGYFSSYLNDIDYGNVRVDFTDGVGFSTGFDAIDDSADAGPNNVWSLSSASGNVPVGTVSARVSLYGTAAERGADGYIDNVDFRIIQAINERVWGIDSGGAASVGANWSGGMAPTSPNDAAAFATAITANRTVTVDVPLSLRRMRFDDNNNYTIAGPQTITLAAPSPDAAAILVENTNGNGAHTIGAPLVVASDLLIAQDSSQPLTIGGTLNNSAGRTITTSGTGAVIVSGAQTHGVGATLVVDDGTLTLNTNAGTNVTRNLTVNANSTTNFGSTQHLAALNVGAGATATLTAGGLKNLVTNGLTIAGGSTPTGKLDVTDNVVAVDYPAAGPNPEATIRAQIIAGRGGMGLGKTWNGATGITSSQAAADPLHNGSIGYAVAGRMHLAPLTSIRGQAIDGSTVVMRYTKMGDANLDGVVNNDDVTILGANYAPNFPRARWDLGDFDYSGSVDNDDVTLLGANYNPNAPVVPAPEGGGVAAVPEPTTFVLLAVGLFAVLICQVRPLKNTISEVPNV